MLYRSNEVAFARSIRISALVPIGLSMESSCPHTFRKTNSTMTRALLRGPTLSNPFHPGLVPRIDDDIMNSLRECLQAWGIVKRKQGMALACLCLNHLPGSTLAEKEPIKNWRATYSGRLTQAKTCLHQKVSSSKSVSFTKSRWRSIVNSSLSSGKKMN